MHRAVLFAAFGLLLVTIGGILFADFLMPIHWLVGSLVVFISYFLLNNAFLGQFFEVSDQLAVRKVRRIALGASLVSMLTLYLFFYLYSGTAFEPRAVDSVQYHDQAAEISAMLLEGDFNFRSVLSDYNIDDYGYNMVLALLYAVFGPHLLVARLFNVLLASLSAGLLFKIGTEVLDRKSALVGTLLFIFSPIYLYYASVSMKEVTMIYLTLLAVHRMCMIFQTKKFSRIDIGVGILALGSLFFFRIVLALTLLTALGMYLTYIFLKTSAFIRRRLVFSLSLLLMILLLGAVLTDLDDRVIDIYTESSVQMDKELAGKSNNAGGADLKKSLFAPVFLVGSLFAPFYSITLIDDQVTQAWLSSGVLIKNVLTIFFLLGLWLSTRFEFRRTGFLILITLIYLVILGSAAHSTSPRYQLVALPFLMLFAGKGMTGKVRLTSLQMIFYLFLLGIVLLGWNYFKLAIRGLI